MYTHYASQTSPTRGQIPSARRPWTPPPPPPPFVPKQRFEASPPPVKYEEEDDDGDDGDDGDDESVTISSLATGDVATYRRKLLTAFKQAALDPDLVYSIKITVTRRRRSDGKGQPDAYYKLSDGTLLRSKTAVVAYYTK